MIIPLGGWKNFAVKVVDRNGNPVVGVKVAWQTPAGGPKIWVSSTNENGIASATNLYTFPNSGTYTQLATIVASNTPTGNRQADSVSYIGPSVTFTYKQE